MTEPIAVSIKFHGALKLGEAARLQKGRLHEAQGEGATGFALSVAGQTNGSIVWIRNKYAPTQICPDGVSPFLDPVRLVLISVLNRLEGLWAAEQALRLRGTNCVILETSDGPDLRESRRLQIAAEESGSLAIVLINGRASTSAAHTRWQCESRKEEAWPALWRLTKSKDGQSGEWCVQFPDRVRNNHAPRLMSVATMSAA